VPHFKSSKREMEWGYAGMRRQWFCAREAPRTRSGAAGCRYSTKHPTPAWRPPPVAGMLVPGKPIMPGTHIPSDSPLTGTGFSRNWQALPASEVTNMLLQGGRRRTRILPYEVAQYKGKAVFNGGSPCPEARRAGQ
jgi:hypothetical protein